MDYETKALERQGIEIFHREVSPGYLEIREQLLGKLSVVGVAYEDIREETAQRNSNRALLQEFVSSLPSYKAFYHARETSLFETAMPETAHAILKSVIWLPSYGYDNAPNRAEPYYVVGITQNDNSHNSLLLFRPESIQEPPTKQHKALLKVVTAKTSKIKEVAGLLNPYEPVINADTLSKKLYSPADDILKIKADSPGSVFLRGKSWWLGDYFNNKYASSTKISIFQGGNPRLLQGVTNQEWARFNIPDRLNILAMLFGKKDELLNS